MKTIIIGSIIAVAAVMAGVVAYRLSTDALAIIIGVVIGLAAFLPTLFLALVVVRRSSQQSQTQHAGPAYPQPPVVVVSGFPNMLPQTLNASQGTVPQQAQLPPPPQQQPRQFRVMGYDTADVEVADGEWTAFD